MKGNVIFTAAEVARRFLLMVFPRVFGMFLLGFYIGRHRMFANLDEHRVLLKRVLTRGTITGLSLAFIGARMEGSTLAPPSLAGLMDAFRSSSRSPERCCSSLRRCRERSMAFASGIRTRRVAVADVHLPARRTLFR